MTGDLRRRYENTGMVLPRPQSAVSFMRVFIIINGSLEDVMHNEGIQEYKLTLRLEKSKSFPVFKGEYIE